MEIKNIKSIPILLLDHQEFTLESIKGFVNFTSNIKADKPFSLQPGFLVKKEHYDEKGVRVFDEIEILEFSMIPIDEGYGKKD